MFRQFASTFGLLLATAAVRADQTDPRLNALFDQLRQAPDTQAANTIENSIWNIWFEAKNPESGRLLQEAMEAMGARDYNAALEAVNKVIGKSPDFAEAWNQRATVYYLIGDYDTSLTDVEQTLKLEPRHFGALAGRGMCYLYMQNPKAALAAFENALAIDPWNPAARMYVDSLKKGVEKQP